MSEKAKKTGAGSKVLTVIGIVLCVILIPILVLNVVLIVKSLVNKDEVPGIGGTTPMVVMTDSMHPVIKSGDLIIVHPAKAEELAVGDVITFFDPDSNGSSVVTHRIAKIETKKGELYFTTKGDANNIEDKTPVPASKLIGKYTGQRFAGLGSFVMFMQSTTGFIVCVICPLVLLIGYDILRRKLYEKKARTENDALMAELEALRAEKAASEARTEEKPADDGADKSSEEK